MSRILQLFCFRWTISGRSMTVIWFLLHKNTYTCIHIIYIHVCENVMNINIYILIRRIYLTLCITVLYENLIIANLVKIFPTFFGTRSFIMATTIEGVWTYSKAFESSPHSHFFICLKPSSMILPSTLRFRSCIFAFDIP